MRAGDLDHLEPDQFAGREFRRHALARLRADEGAPDRGEVGNFPVCGIGPVGVDDVIGDFLILLLVENDDDRADVNEVVVDFVFVHHARVLDPLLEFGDLHGVFRLLVLRLVVFAVLGKVAVAAGGRNVLLDDLSLLFQFVQLCFQVVKTCLGARSLSVAARRILPST